MFVKATSDGFETDEEQQILSSGGVEGHSEDIKKEEEQK
jgi:hypothetical protein